MSGTTAAAEVTALELRQSQVQSKAGHVRGQLIRLPVGVAGFVIVARVGQVEAEMGEACRIARTALHLCLPQRRGLSVVPRPLCCDGLCRLRRLPKDQGKAHEQQKECDAFHDRYLYSYGSATQQ